MRSVRISLLAIAVASVPAAGILAGSGFIENVGQIDDAVLFYGSGERARVFFTASGPVLEIRSVERPSPTPGEPARDLPMRARERRAAVTVRRHAVHLRFVQADPAPRVEGLGRLASRFNFFTGRDRGGWRTGVSAYEEVVYRDVWPGIDVAYRWENGDLSYRWIVAPGADPSSIVIAYDGGKALEATGGATHVVTPVATLIDRTDGAGVGSILLSPGGDRPTSPAEPRSASDDSADTESTGPGMDLRWSTYLGGQRDDAVYAVAIGADGRPVVAGATRSTDFPATAGALDPSYNASFDAFVAKLDEDGSTLLWSTFLGDTGDDRAWALAIDGSGRPVVAGVTTSAGFPTSAGAYDETHNGEHDAFVAKLASDGSALVWSTLYGGALREWDVSGLDLDGLDRPVLIGSTGSNDLPTTTGAWAESPVGGFDAFVAKLESDGTALLYGTYLGGTGNDFGEDVAFDASGRAIVAGRTDSTDYPVTAGAFQGSPGGLQDCFVTAIAPDGGSLEFATYLAGSDTDECFGVALDGSGRPVVSGGSYSGDFPTTPGSFAHTPAGLKDAIVAVLEADGSDLVWSSFFGGSSSESALAAVVDASDRVVFTGWTCSTDFPLAGPPWDDTFDGPCEVFVARLDGGGTFPVYSTFVGGWRDDSGFALGLDGLGRPIVGGEALSSDFPATAGAYDPDHNSPDEWYDGFVLSMLTPTCCTHVTGTGDPQLVIEKGLRGNCPQQTPEGFFIDLIEGDLDRLGPDDIGDVRAIACASTDATFENDSVPAPGKGFFQLARYSPGGSYTDGGGAGLVGGRIPLSGDCP